MAYGYYPENFNPQPISELCTNVPRAAYVAAVTATENALAEGKQPPLVKITRDLSFRGEVVLPQMDNILTPETDTIGVHPGCREDEYPSLVGTFFRDQIDFETGGIVPAAYPRAVVSAYRSGVLFNRKVRLEVWETPFTEPSGSKLKLPQE